MADKRLSGFFRYRCPALDSGLLRRETQGQRNPFSFPIYANRRSGNFHCLMTLIAKFNPKNFKFISKDMRYEILNTIAHSLLRNFIDKVKRESHDLSKEQLFSIIIDETTDMNRLGQVSFCLHFYDSKMVAKKCFWDSTNPAVPKLTISKSHPFQVLVVTSGSSC